MFKNVYWLDVKCPLFLSDLKETWIFSTDFRKILKYQISWNPFHWDPICSIQTEGRQPWRNPSKFWNRV